MPDQALLVTLFSAIGTAITLAVSTPQLIRLARTRNVNGVSAATSALTAVSGLSWGTYAWAQHLTLLTISSYGAVVVQAPMLALLSRGGAWPARSRLLCAALLAGYATVAVLFGWNVLAICLVSHVVIQYSPQVWAVLRTDDLSGISETSARLLVANGITWGLAGLFASDAPLVAWGVVVTCTGLTVLTRVRVTREHWAGLSATAH